MSPSTHFRSFVYPQIYILHFSLSLSSLLPSHHSRHTRIFSPSSRVRLECGRPVPIATALTSPLSQTFRHSLSPTHALILASVHSQGLSTITQSQILQNLSYSTTADISNASFSQSSTHTNSLSLGCVCVECQGVCYSSLQRSAPLPASSSSTQARLSLPQLPGDGCPVLTSLARGGWLLSTCPPLCSSLHRSRPGSHPEPARSLTPSLNPTAGDTAPLRWAKDSLKADR